MSSRVDADLQKERDKCTFNTEHLAFVLDGGQAVTQRRRYIEKLALQDETFGNVLDYYFMSRDDIYSDAIKRTAQYIKKTKELGLTDVMDLRYYESIAFPIHPMPTTLQVTMFPHAIMAQASEEQKAKWMPLITSYDIIGTYAQTELGHGTHVRGLETTATYDPKTEEFVINSPTQTAIKWWPGGLGKTSNHALTMAQLYTSGYCYGMHAFLVPIRDMQTHEPLPGVTVGDIGPKFGYDSMDNGFLKFDHVRIPRDNMLMRNSEVLRNGEYIGKTENKKLTYGTMVFIRASFVNSSGKALAQACTIATRYSAVRRQSELQPGAPEPQIMDYQTQQYKLFPLISTAYAYLFIARRILEIYSVANDGIMKGKTAMLPELHALSAGLKAFSSYGAMAGIEQCRLACGGLGYSHASGLPKIYVNTVPIFVTGEGENSVMYLQTARYLMKAFQQASVGQKLTDSVAYLSEKNFDKCVIGEECGLETLVAAYKHRAKRHVVKAAQKIYELANTGKPQHETSNMSAVPLTRAAETHCHLYTVQTFVDMAEKVDTSGPVKVVLKQLCTLYALYGISENAGDFVEDGFMTSQQLSFIEQKVLDLLAYIRPNAVSLADAFDFRDHQLCSILGRYDGQVYSNVYEWAQKSPLNKTEVHESYYKYIQPLKKSQSHL